MRKEYAFEIDVEVETLSADEEFFMEYMRPNKLNGEEKRYTDKISLGENRITITGTRTKPIEKEAYYTIESPHRRATERALLYAFLKYGSFRMKKISFLGDDGKLLAEPSIRDKDFFYNDFPGQVEEAVFSKIFDLSNKKEADAIARVLIFIQSANIVKTSDRFHYTWRAFNAIYDWYGEEYEVTGGELKRLSKILEIVENNPESYALSIKSGAKFLEKEFSDSRFFNVTNYKHRKLKEEVKEFKKYYNLDSYQDGQVRTILKTAMENKFSKFFDLLTNNEKNYNKYIDADLTIDRPSDRLKLAIWYIYYFRCKIFHGEFRLTDFLVENDNTKELESFCKVLLPLVIEMLNDLYLRGE